MRRHVTSVALIVAVVGTGLAAGCSSRRGPVNTGPGSSQYERRQFAGEWVLVSYNHTHRLPDSRYVTTPGPAAGDS